MSSWEQAVKNLFQSHPRAISAKTVIEAIKSASESPTILPPTKPDDTIVTYRASELWEMRRQFLQAGARAEQERIIKLLEEHHLTAASELIEQDALIKGENK